MFKRWTRVAFNAAVLLTWLFLAACNSDTPQSRSGTVLFDEGHGQRFLVERQGKLDLSALAGILREEGAEIRTTDSVITEDALSDVDALVISGAFSLLAPSETEAIGHFVKTGGRLCVMLHVGPPVAALLQKMGVSISNGVVLEQENLIDDEPANFHVIVNKPHQITEGLERFSVYGAWALLNRNDRVRIIARTGPGAWVDLNRDRKFGKGDVMQAFGVAVAGQFGEGKFVVFGDDAIFQNTFLTGDNLVLAKNLGKWLLKRQ